MAEWRIFAHRGARAHAPENTWPALVAALQSGAHGWEGDVRLTRDHVPVVVHDNHLARTSDWAFGETGKTPWISRHTYAELLALDFGAWFAREDPFATIRSGEVGPAEIAAFSGTRVVSLSNALAFAAAHTFYSNIEIKDHYGQFADEAVVTAVLAAVAESGIAPELVLFSSFRSAYLKMLARRSPAVDRALLVARPLIDPVPWLRRLAAKAYHPRRDCLAAEDVPRLREAGVDVHIYTVNDMAEARQWHAAGANGIFTDYPRQMVAAFADVP
ncbi:MAG: glycerophosphodiester phosphodiesterase [Thermodesulfobacteriota bacterium]